MNLAEYSTCLLLGSNIEPEKYLPRAVNLLQQQMAVIQTSSVWESQAIGSEGPNFLNAAVLALTQLNADSLKEQVLRPMEVQLGRVRTADKNAPRTIDIDLILFDQHVLDAALWQYAHCAVPVAEILPKYQSKTGAYLKDTAAHLSRMTPVWIRKEISTFPFSTRFQERS
ncbi:MAG: 2-amino-4-hydroxy-6-hydroxymethyldihydropteridine diphosphokinase [Anaerolineaceae bacterium]|jgi:2-amino-4-hydroxy-6-hydroxymethyldihydropteridine diphosphokinase|nr:2-amino-4-hydroxy-6-hydroxymethyldihydropteridine diphosphokinase [Anaerolineaceae bacterium]